ncbi:MAG: peptidyl-prolyl cis-trans isomerase [Planctomycetota bacterium]
MLGGLVFALYAWTRNGEERSPREEIVISAGEVRQLVTVFEKTWQRPPTADEIDKMIDRRVREEVFFREALAAGLDEDDAIVRRRMQQKLEFMLEDIAGQVAPTEEELRAFLEENSDKFRAEPRYSFRHAYFSTDKREDAASDARKLLPRLTPESDPAGDRLMMIEAEFRNAPEREVARSFGREFAAALADAPVGRWSGPIASGYGLHLVLVSSKEEGRVPKLDEVREPVIREWRVAKRAEMNEELYRKLRAKYSVTVEKE